MLEPDAPIPAPSQGVDTEPEPVGQDVTRRQPGSQDVTANPEPDAQDVDTEPVPDGQDVDAEPEAEPSRESVDDMLRRMAHCGAAMSGRSVAVNSQAERLSPLPNYPTERRHYTWQSSQKSTNIRSGHWKVWQYVRRYWQATDGSCGSFTYRVWTAKHRYAARKSSWPETSGVGHAGRDCNVSAGAGSWRPKPKPNRKPIAGRQNAPEESVSGAGSAGAGSCRASGAPQLGRDTSPGQRQSPAPHWHRSRYRTGGHGAAIRRAVASMLASDCLLFRADRGPDATGRIPQRPRAGCHGAYSERKPRGG
jgi:hypothetical protein